MSIAGARLLLVLPQLPQDPASGAARSTRTMCEMLAAAGAEVRAVATTASERHGRADSSAYLRELGIQVHLHRGREAGRVRPELEFVDRGIHYHLLDVGPRDMHAWQKIVGAQFDRIFDRELHSFHPDMLLAFGGLPGDVRRYERARRQGARIVFSLRNEGYINEGGRELLDGMDGVLTPSQYLTDYYRARIGIDSTALPLPMELDDVLAPERDPIFFTMINPSPQKGLMVMATLAQELSLRRPDIPLLIVESRGSAGKLVAAGLAGGFDLRRHDNLIMAPALAQPKEIYLATRALLAPSLWQEPAGRVAAEAILNGIPPLVSDRGGLAESCNGAGFVLPLPADFTVMTRRPVPASAVEPWIEPIAKLAFDDEFYNNAVEKTRQAARMYAREELAPRYVNFFIKTLES